MPKKPETLFKEKVQKYLKTIPNLYARKINQVALRGMPDLLVCYKGHFIAMELKVGNNNTDALQEYDLQMVRAAGGIAWVVTPENFNDIKEKLRCLNGL